MKKSRIKLLAASVAVAFTIASTSTMATNSTQKPPGAQSEPTLYSLVMSYFNS
jgi:hypothetical protein